MGKEETKLALYANDRTVHRGNPSEFPLQLVNKRIHEILITLAIKKSSSDIPEK